MDEEILQDMYPEIHKRMMPWVDEAIDTYWAGDGDLTEEGLNNMAHHLVKKSNFYNDPPPQWHNERSAFDIAKALVLGRLLSDGDDSLLFPFFGPIPFFFGGRDRDRGGHRRRRFDGRRRRY